MNLTETYQKERLDELKNLYETAFPASEQKPFELMLKKREEGDAELLSIEDGGAFWVLPSWFPGEIWRC